MAKLQVEHLLQLRPDAHVEIFPKMNHGQLLVDYLKEVANYIQRLVKKRWILHLIKHNRLFMDESDGLANTSAVEIFKHVVRIEKKGSRKLRIIGCK